MPRTMPRPKLVLEPQSRLCVMGSRSPSAWDVTTISHGAHDKKAGIRCLLGASMHRFSRRMWLSQAFSQQLQVLNSYYQLANWKNIVPIHSIFHFRKAFYTLSWKVYLNTQKLRKIRCVWGLCIIVNTDILWDHSLFLFLVISTKYRGPIHQICVWYIAEKEKKGQIQIFPWSKNI